MAFLDFSTGFDTVDHNILTRKLKTEYGVGEIALNRFKSNLSNRNYKQRNCTAENIYNVRQTLRTK